MDLTGSREIMMRAFGAGRRVCPGIDAALLHLRYFVANLVRELRSSGQRCPTRRWTELLEMSIVMRRLLRAKVVPCIRKHQWNISKISTS